VGRHAARLAWRSSCQAQKHVLLGSSIGTGTQRPARLDWRMQVQVGSSRLSLLLHAVEYALCVLVLGLHVCDGDAILWSIRPDITILRQEL
jgi:hypothetical protein